MMVLFFFFGGDEDDDMLFVVRVVLVPVPVIDVVIIGCVFDVVVDIGVDDFAQEEEEEDDDDDDNKAEPIVDSAVLILG